MTKSSSYRRGMLDAMNACGLFSSTLTKTAASRIKMLARAGKYLNGVSGRQLKFMQRRGLTGFTPEQVSMLRSRGMLPSVDREIAGANKGTLNMFDWTPSSGKKMFGIDPTQKMQQLQQKHLDDLGYQANLDRRSAKIPDLSDQTGSVRDRVTRTNIGRHEAREWVRGNAAMARGRGITLPGHKGDFGDLMRKPEIGSSHMPGVIHDERVFYNGMRNRLGADAGLDPWGRMTLGTIHGVPVHRGPRDLFVGSKPLKYEFDRINEWHRRQAADKALVASMRPSHRDVDRRADKIIAAARRRSRRLMEGDPRLSDMGRRLNEWEPYYQQDLLAKRLDRNKELLAQARQDLAAAERGERPLFGESIDTYRTMMNRRISDLEKSIARASTNVKYPEGYSPDLYGKLIDDHADLSTYYTDVTGGLFGSPNKTQDWLVPYRRNLDNIAPALVSRGMMRQGGRYVRPEAIEDVTRGTSLLDYSPELAHIKKLDLMRPDEQAAIRRAMPET